jgi:hypothetical protein
MLAHRRKGSAARAGMVGQTKAIGQQLVGRWSPEPGILRQNGVTELLRKWMLDFRSFARRSLALRCRRVS